MKSKHFPLYFKTREQYILSVLLSYAIAWGVFFLFGYSFFNQYLTVIFLTIAFSTFTLLYLYLSNHQIIFSDYFFISQSFLRVNYIKWEDIVSIETLKLPNPFLFGMLGEYLLIKFGDKHHPKSIHLNVSHINHESDMIRELDNSLMRHRLSK